ncbi:MAG: energy transducer TonB [Candidatus Rokubacteria bacterium]|nr:energy transducer TonB [Candidatus Rokubacteria bacterium]
MSRLAALGASFLAHGAAVLLVFVLAASESAPAVLLVDLTREPVPAGERVAAPPAGAAASRSPAVPAGARRGRPAPPAGPPAVFARAPAPVPVPAPAQPAAEPPGSVPVTEPARIAPDVPGPPRPPASQVVDAPSVPPPEPSTRAGIQSGKGVGGSGPAGPESDVGAGVGLGPSAMAGSDGAGRSGERGGLAGTWHTALAAPTPAPTESGAAYGGYLAEVRRRIQEALRYPQAARRRGLSGTVQIEILIEPDGAIGGVTLAASSSHRLLDEAALDTVRRLAPTPFPADLIRRPLRVKLPVVFELR